MYNWKDIYHQSIKCDEKIKVLNQNSIEIKQYLLDFYEDALLIGVNPKQISEYLHSLVENLQNITGLKNYV